MTAVIYLRISSDPQLERLGVERQREDCERLADARGYRDVVIIEDNDTSAAGKVERVGFERLCRMIADDEVDAVIAWAFDRLTRNRRDQLRLMELGQDHNLMIHLCRGADMDLSTPSGRMSADILASVARNEIEVKSDRQRAANRQQIAKGNRLAGRRSFGYTNASKSAPPTPIEDEAQAVRDGYAWLLDGVSLREIARRWNARGLTTPQGRRHSDEAKDWTGSAVSRCLRKPIYAGLLSYRGDIQGTGNWEPIIDQSTYWAAMSLLTAPHRKPPKGNQKLLSGLARCGLCGATVHASGGKTGLGVYSCSGPIKHLTRKREPIDAWVRLVVIERLSRADALQALTPTHEDIDVSAITARMSQITETLDGLAALFAGGHLTAAGVERESQRLHSELEGLRERLDAAVPMSSHVHDLIASEDVAEAWDALSVDTQREVIRSLFDVTLHRPIRGARTFDPSTVSVTPKQ